MEVDTPITWKIQDVEAYLGVERHWIVARCKLPVGDPERIPHARIGKLYRFSPRQVVDWFETKSRCTPDSPAQDVA